MKLTREEAMERARETWKLFLDYYDAPNNAPVPEYDLSGEYDWSSIVGEDDALVAQGALMQWLWRGTEESRAAEARALFEKVNPRYRKTAEFLIGRYLR